VSQAFQQEVHLLRPAALDDFVPLVQPHGFSFPNHDLKRDLLLDEAFQLVGTRWWTPLRQPGNGQLLDIVVR